MKFKGKKVATTISLTIKETESAARFLLQPPGFYLLDCYIRDAQHPLKFC